MTSGKHHVDAATKYARSTRLAVRISPLTVADATNATSIAAAATSTTTTTTIIKKKSI